MCLVEEGRFGFSFVLWTDSRKCPGEGGRGFKESSSSADGQAHLWALGIVWALCSLGCSSVGLQYLYCWSQCLNALAWQVFIADLFSSWKEVHKQSSCHRVGNLHQVVRLQCPSGAPLQMVWLHRCGNCVVVVKLGLFVNLLRCLDGWLATDFIGQY